MAKKVMVMMLRSMIGRLVRTGRTYIDRALHGALVEVLSSIACLERCRKPFIRALERGAPDLGEPEDSLSATTHARSA